MTQPEMILEAARSLPPEFTQEDLIVTAWNNWPQTFGLRHFEKTYPDSNKVICCLVGVRGLVAQGFLQRKGPKRYSVTAQADAKANGEVKANGQVSASEREEYLRGNHHAAMLRYMKRVKVNGFEAKRAFEEITR